MNSRLGEAAARTKGASSTVALDKTAIQIRRRGLWEALDLGLLMVRRWWRPLTLIWLAQALPLFLLLHLLFWGSWEWAVLLLWWFKPLLERPLLYFLSQAIFQQPPTVGAVIRHSLRLMRPQWFLSLTWRRFSPSRSLDLPVLMLEGASGAERQKRLAVLHRQQTQPAIWLTLFAAHLEYLVLIGVMILAQWLVPETIEFDIWSSFDTPTLLTDFVGNLLWLGAISVVAPLYIACGFALYLNRRIQLEAWDLELVFRQLAHRLGGWVVTLLIPLLLLVPTSNLWAQTLVPETAHAKAVEILQGPDFHRVETIERPVFWDQETDDEDEVDDESDDNSLDFSWLEWVVNVFSQLWRVLLWLAAGGLILWIIWRYRAWILEHLPRSPVEIQSPEPMIETLFGLDLRVETLPPKPGERAWQLWSEGQSRASLALLYRCTLWHLMDQYAVRFKEGDTEGDCLRRVRQGIEPLADYFERLTQLWQQQAYAHHAVEDDRVRALCLEWADHFEVAP